MGAFLPPKVVLFCFLSSSPGSFLVLLKGEVPLCVVAGNEAVPWSWRVEFSQETRAPRAGGGMSN